MFEVYIIAGGEPKLMASFRDMNDAFVYKTMLAWKYPHWQIDIIYEGTKEYEMEQD